jgi:hypothetical protein
MNGANSILIILYCCCIQLLYAQNSDVQTGYYHEFRNSTPLEVLRIETDRDLYLAGEKICFSVRGCAAASGSYPAVSDVICVELINAQNEITEQQRLRADGLFTSGEFVLPPLFQTGYYRIQAYTVWSRNFGQALMAKKYIRVINASRDRAIDGISEEFLKSPQHHLTLHPTYGKMLVNTKNRIIVKALTGFLHPMSGKGTVYTAAGDSLAGFSTDSTGLGAFEIIPLPNAEYSLHFTSSSGSILVVKLPPSEDGMGINISIGKDVGELEIIRTAGFDPSGRLDLLITGGIDIVYHREDIQWPGEERLSVPLPGEPGVYTAFLVTTDRHVTAQTSFFVPPVLKKIVVRTNTQDPGTREKVQVYLEHPQQGPGESSYALTVTRDMKILSRSYLSDWLDLSGVSLIPRIEHMNIPVADQEVFAKVMEKYVHTVAPVLTPEEIIQLWRCTWELPPEHGGEILSGKITTREGGEPVSGQAVVLSFMDRSVEMFHTVTDASGKFAFLLKDAENVCRITICCYPPDDSKIIYPDNPYSGSLPGEMIPPVIPGESCRKELEDLFLSAQVQQAYPGESPGGEQSYNPAKDGFYGKADFHLVMDRYIDLPVMEEVFFELVRKVVVSGSKESPELLVLDENVPHVIGKSPLILLDGVPFIEPVFVLSLRPSDIESIRVVHYRYYLENLSFDGIIDIRTTRGEITNGRLPPGALGLDYHFTRRASVPRFPEHSNEEAGQKRIPDYRNLLYWDPCIADWSDIAFYTSDQTGAYRITAREFTGGRLTGLGSCLINIR